MRELLILYGKTITVNLQTQNKTGVTEQKREEDTNKQVETETESSRVSNMIIHLASP